MPKPSIVIIGAGAAGFQTALKLASQEYAVVLIEKNVLCSGATGNNPGRMGHGFHYIDINTALAYLRASVQVQRAYPDYLIGDASLSNDPLRHGRYFIMKDSKAPKDDILKTYQAIQTEYQRLCTLDIDSETGLSENQVFGAPESFFRILEYEEDYQFVNRDIVDIGIETSECLFRWETFVADIRGKLEAHPNITLREHANVSHITRNGLDEPRFTIHVDTQDGPLVLKTDYIVNSTWSEIQSLNDQIGLRMVPGERTNRLKALLVLKLPDSLKQSHSMFFCMGEHCMVSNMGDGEAMATFAKLTNLEASTELSMSDKAQRFLNGGATEAEKRTIAEEMLDGISHYIPEMTGAEIVDVKFGVVQTAGLLTLEDLSDPSHSFHKRDDTCIRSAQIGVISNPCMKLFYFIQNGEIVAEMIDKHVVATEVIRKAMVLIINKAVECHFKLNATQLRVIQEHLERNESATLKSGDETKLSDQIFSMMQMKRNLSQSRCQMMSKSSLALTVNRNTPMQHLRLEFQDRFLTRRVLVTFENRSQIDAPLHVMEAAAARLHLPRGYAVEHQQARSPSAYMRVPLCPAQLQRVAIGFTVAASHALATAPARARVDAWTTRRWGTLILVRVMGGLVAMIQERDRASMCSAVANVGFGLIE